MRDALLVTIRQSGRIECSDSIPADGELSDHSLKIASFQVRTEKVR